MKNAVFIILTAAVVMLAGCQKQDESGRFIEYFEKTASILYDNIDNPEKAVSEMDKFMSKNKTDYIAVTEAVNNLPEEGKKKLVEDYGERLIEAFDKLWESAFTEVGQNEEILEMFEGLPNLDLTAFDKYFPKEEEE